MAQLDTKFTWFWVIWIAQFLVFEIWALVRDARGDTLSEHVWAVMRSDALATWLFAGFLLWMVVHFLAKGRWV